MEDKIIKFEKPIKEMKDSILECLSKLEKGYGNRKWYISKETVVPENILTPLLKELKDSGEIELMMIWSEETGLPNGSGYCLKGNISWV